MLHALRWLFSSFIASRPSRAFVPISCLFTLIISSGGYTLWDPQNYHLDLDRLSDIVSPLSAIPFGARLLFVQHQMTLFFAIAKVQSQRLHVFSSFPPSIDSHNSSYVALGIQHPERLLSSAAVSRYISRNKIIKSALFCCWVFSFRHVHNTLYPVGTIHTERENEGF